MGRQQPRALATDDAGVTCGEHQAERREFKRQDLAFCRALAGAIERGKERAPIGIITAPDDIRPLTRIWPLPSLYARSSIAASCVEA